MPSGRHFQCRPQVVIRMRPPNTTEVADREWRAVASCSDAAMGGFCRAMSHNASAASGGQCCAYQLCTFWHLACFCCRDDFSATNALHLHAHIKQHPCTHAAAPALAASHFLCAATPNTREVLIQLPGRDPYHFAFDDVLQEEAGQAEVFESES